MRDIKENHRPLFLEELQKRVTIPEGEFEKFLELCEFKKLNRNEFILKAGEIPKFSIWGIRGGIPADEMDLGI